MDDHALRGLYEAHRDAPPAPSVTGLRAWVDELLELLFPELAHARTRSMAAFQHRWELNRDRLVELLGDLNDTLPGSPDALADALDRQVPALRAALLEDADAIYTGDPAAVDHAEVIRTYPGFLAIAVYRIAHFFCLQRVPVIPRVLTEYAHTRTGIDIHPGARIGDRFCIDHGTGIVVGETTQIGRGVKLYQGVTLGALSVAKGMARTKRHPTVEDDVVIYTGATILGGDTVVGRGSVIGGSVWLLHSVPPGSRVYYDPEVVVEEQRD
ncbi:MAG: serine O-acetyltransferase, partial [Gemmatimonadota bacterium]